MLTGAVACPSSSRIPCVVYGGPPPIAGFCPRGSCGWREPSLPLVWVPSEQLSAKSEQQSPYLLQASLHWQGSDSLKPTWQPRAAHLPAGSGRFGKGSHRGGRHLGGHFGGHHFCGTFGDCGNPPCCGNCGGHQCCGKCGSCQFGGGCGGCQSRGGRHCFGKRLRAAASTAAPRRVRAPRNNSGGSPSMSRRRRHLQVRQHRLEGGASASHSSQSSGCASLPSPMLRVWRPAENANSPAGTDAVVRLPRRLLRKRQAARRPRRDSLNVSSRGRSICLCGVSNSMLREPCDDIGVSGLASVLMLAVSGDAGSSGLTGGTWKVGSRLGSRLCCILPPIGRSEVWPQLWARLGPVGSPLAGVSPGPVGWPLRARLVDGEDRCEMGVAGGAHTATVADEAGVTGGAAGGAEISGEQGSTAVSSSLSSGESSTIARTRLPQSAAHGMV
mmetsp:Transcript_20276/g.55966  ORF Transcript_20276/g.55966 Transcript_20276/m.55966 type:complete len:443 (-) Transcript_20276:19-1347(-)